MSDEVGFKGDKSKKSTRIVNDYSYDPSKGRLVKDGTVSRDISELCQYCPEDCEGCLQQNAKNACDTMKDWRNDKISDRKAQTIKQKEALDEEQATLEDDW